MTLGYYHVGTLFSFFLTVFLNVESQVCRLLHLTEVMHVLCVYMRYVCTCEYVCNCV